MEECGPKDFYLVLSDQNKKILSQKRASETTYPASLTKLMTLYLTFEAIENKKLTPTTTITISERGEEISNVNKVNTLRLKKGDKMTVRQAILGVIVKSFNESATTLGEAVAGNEWNFARKMNEKAQELGMINTSFRNSTGLHEEGQYTSSYDLVRLVLAIHKNFPGYYHLFAIKEFDYRGTKYKTHNNVLLDYKGAEGLKTGFTNASGFNLISAARQEEKRIFSVVMGCSSVQKRDELTKKLLRNGFDAVNESEKTGTNFAKPFDYKAVREVLSDYDGNVRFGTSYGD